jgi:rRNA maturation endonuclease Nob1
MPDSRLSFHHFWSPRCEGCGRFVPTAGHHSSDFRWCDSCADGLRLEDYIRRAMVDRTQAEAHGWPMWPLSDVARSAA